MVGFALSPYVFVHTSHNTDRQGSRQSDYSNVIIQYLIALLAPKKTFVYFLIIFLPFSLSLSPSSKLFTFSRFTKLTFYYVRIELFRSSWSSFNYLANSNLQNKQFEEAKWFNSFPITTIMNRFNKSIKIKHKLLSTFIC